MDKKQRNRLNKSLNENLKIKKNIHKIEHKIVIMSGKGGVGKSTVAKNLAFSLSTYRADVGLYDADNYGHVLNINGGIF